ncbi:Sporulation protein Spo0E [Candidatus Desulfosporosinus infrequens]|uniref:Sporulation protein Spo0E n=1 Tax=Candidatus Desulfosporosinus infrequens TaxID=2043169 RepID=A0A2U3KKW2_9FIRM|nr:Sporulation protein Spo0E [Candidatus Desulfosporosinus infrequens]
MEYQISNLNMLIEITREKLVQIGNSHKSFTHPEVVELSQKLDRLLDEYQALHSNPKCKTT